MSTFQLPHPNIILFGGDIPLCPHPIPVAGDIPIVAKHNH